MARTQISIKLDEDLLVRVDKLAADVGSNRTAVIEQAIKNDLPEQEAFHKSLENPVMRAIHERITSPSMLRLLAKLASEEVSEAEIARIVERAPVQRDLAKDRATQRKAARKPRVEGA